MNRRTRKCNGRAGSRLQLWNGKGDENSIAHKREARAYAKKFIRVDIASIEIVRRTKTFLINFASLAKVLWPTRDQEDGVLGFVPFQSSSSLSVTSPIPPEISSLTRVA